MSVRGVIWIGLAAGLALSAFLLLPATARSEVVFEDAWGRTGGHGQFLGAPAGIAVALSGDVLVTDPVASQVKVFAPDGGLIRRWGSFGAGDGQFFLGGPHAIDVAPSGEVFVTDPGNHRVQAFQPDGEFIRTWGSEGSGSGQFAGTIAGIAADSAGSVVVTESGLTEAGHQVQVFDAEGNFLRRWGGFGSGDGEFWSPTGVAVNGATGEAFVADSANWRVQALDRTGAFVRKWGSCCGHDGELGGTGGLGLDFEAVDPTDALIRKWGRCCGDDTEFGSPEGLDLDPLGRVLVADPSMARIQLFTRSGAFLSSWGSCCAAPVWEVTDLAVGPSGKIYALDSANADTGAHPRIQQFAIVPATRIDSAPGGVIRDETPMFTFSADEPASSFDCRLDPEPWSGCTSPWVAPGPLADGPHRFGVRATDSVGTPDPTPATRDFTVDTAGP